MGFLFADIPPYHRFWHLSWVVPAAGDPEYDRASSVRQEHDCWSTRKGDSPRIRWRSIREVM